jgi:hypothetical protein
VNRGDLDHNFVIAQALKISILRLMARRALGHPDLHPDDWAFGEDALILALGDLDNAYSREALVDLMEFPTDDTLSDAMGEVLYKHGDALLPHVRKRIGAPLCAEAARSNGYLQPVSTKSRDKRLEGVLFEMKPENRARMDEWLRRRKGPK